MTGATSCTQCGSVLAVGARFCGHCGAPVAAAVPVGAAPRPRYAGFIRRWVAFSIIDGTLALVGALAIGAAVELALTPFFAEELEADAPLVRGFIGVTVLSIYGAYFWWGNASGRSLGKRTLGLRVVHATDQTPPGWGRGLVRTVGYLISALPLWLGFLWALWDADKQTWHDKLAGTIVIADG